MFAHIWSGRAAPNYNYLYVDPATGTDTAGHVLTTTYNDFAHMHFLGAVHTATSLFDAAHLGPWYCVEAHARLNDAGLSNGVEEIWLNDVLEARHANMNWVGRYGAYGINAV